VQEESRQDILNFLHLVCEDQDEVEIMFQRVFNSFEDISDNGGKIKLRWPVKYAEEANAYFGQVHKGKTEAEVFDPKKMYTPYVSTKTIRVRYYLFSSFFPSSSLSFFPNTLYIDICGKKPFDIST
jgi:hypothetical protein